MRTLLGTPAPRAGVATRRLAGALLALAAACGGGDKTPTSPGDGPPPAAGASTISFTAGDGQTAPVGSALSAEPAVRVLDGAGRPVPNVAVRFTAADGDAVANAAVSTNGDGVATPGVWTLGGTPGEHALTAAVTAGGRTLSATARATARLPRWTVMVYMAADNTLAVAGVKDVDEMEAAGDNPEVRTVVQAEFSQAQFARAGCSAQCANLPNFDTFRYQVRGGLRHVTGPDGPVQAIGNRDMTDPAQLREFVAWAKANAPAEHYALVLWNHGGGYVGLLEDETSRPQHMMSLPELRAALTGGDALDVVDFDMCLMAGYETLAQLAGLAKVAVFSEAVEPGAGLPYTELLTSLMTHPTADARDAGRLFVQAWVAHYRGGRESTTQSAYDLAELPAFLQAFDAAAGTLRGLVSTQAGAVRAAAAGAQRYTYPFLADVGDAAERIAAGTGDATLQARLAALAAQATHPRFRIANYAENGSADTTDVTRSTGLHVLLPAGDLPASGPASFAAYQAQFGATAWAQFLDAYLHAAPTRATVDQGARAFQTYLVWDSAAVSRQADVDLWVLEPNGNVYVPWQGTVTPNGHLSAPSEDAGTFYEGYATNRHVEAGTYQVLAYLYADPQNVRPRYDLLYRFGSAGDFASVYEDEPDYPRLSTARRLEDDGTPTWDEVLAGAYTDVQLAGTYTAASDAAAAARFGTGGPALARSAAGGPALARSSAGAGAGITPAQWTTLRRLAAERHLARRAGAAGPRPAPERAVERALRAHVPTGTR